ncbi:MAG: PQQ-binding-like beta-propeller repeat protein, partial [Gammaproteobacteria bacterium]
MKSITISSRVAALFFAVTLVSCGGDTPAENTDEQSDGGGFAAQANAGAAAYATQCAACHGEALQGTQLGPMLSGGGFLGSYGRQSPADFFNFLKANMPPGGNQGISDEAYWSIVAHVMRGNGVADTNPMLDGTASYAMASNIPGVNPSLLVAASEPNRPTGVVVPGTVADFTPITAAMLRDPDPADWPMLRRNFQAWSYSPLDQIDTGNVAELRLQWMWSMHEGDSEPSPLVYDGIIYLINTSNIVQALDGKTGELIWEHYAGPFDSEDMRNIAIYNDKIIHATTDARLLALDARTGEPVWEIQIADGSKGFGNSSGPIVADGKIIQGLLGCSRYIEEDCYISAYDADNGELLWRFNTIAETGQPGGDTWGNLPDLFRAGG